MDAKEKELDLYERFRTEFLPKIQEDLLAGKTAEEILKAYAPVAAARLVMNAITDPDSGKSTGAAKNIIDYASGKAVERQEVRHKLDKVTDQQLDSILSSELEDLNKN